MNRFKYGIMVLGACSLSSTAWAGQKNIEQPLRLSLDLVDGSKIIGVPDIKSFPIQTTYAKMKVPLNQALNINIHDDHETVAIEFNNGDRVKGALSLGSIGLETLLGEVEVEVCHIKRMTVTASSTTAPLHHLPKELSAGYHLMTGDVASLPLCKADTSLSFEAGTWHIHQPEGYITFFELPTSLAITPPQNSKTGAVNMKQHLFTHGTKVGVYTCGKEDDSTKPKILGSVSIQELQLSCDGTWTYASGGGGQILNQTAQ